MEITPTAQLSTPHLDLQANVPLLAFSVFVFGGCIYAGVRRGCYFSAGLGGLGAIALTMYASISETFWRTIPDTFRIAQFAYRMITYIDVSAMITCALFIGALVSPGRIGRRAVIGCLWTCLAISTVSMFVKLAHARDVQERAVVSGSGLRRTARFELVRLPSSFYGVPDYSSPAGMAGYAEGQSELLFPIGAGPAFGYPLAIGLHPRKDNDDVVRTNVQAFPWNHIIENGSDIPLDRLRYDKNTNTVIVVPREGGPMSIEVQPDTAWIVLRSMGFIVAGLWATAVIASALLASRFAQRRVAARMVMLVSLTLFSACAYSAFAGKSKGKLQVADIAAVIGAHPIDTNVNQMAELVRPSLVFVEDRRFSGISLVAAAAIRATVYLDDEHRTLAVPSMSTTTPSMRQFWMRNQPAMYIRYDGVRWTDDSPKFRVFVTDHPTDSDTTPVITAIYPRGTKRGVGFNVQPDGRSAMSVEGRWFEPGSVVVVSGRRLETMFVSSESLTVILPNDLFANAGDVPMQVKNADNATSAAIMFAVRP
jgi:hypothetical protein